MSKRDDHQWFEALVDAYGAEPEAWPVEDREVALALLERSDQARRLQAEAAALDELLAAAPDIDPSTALRQRVLAAAPRGEEPSWLSRLDAWTERLWPFSPRWQPATALVAAGIMGVVLGAGFPEADGTSESEDVVELAFGSDEYWSSDNP